MSEENWEEEYAKTFRTMYSGIISDEMIEDSIRWNIWFIKEHIPITAPAEPKEKCWKCGGKGTVEIKHCPDKNLIGMVMMPCNICRPIDIQLPEPKKNINKEILHTNLIKVLMDECHFTRKYNEGDRAFTQLEFNNVQDRFKDILDRFVPSGLVPLDEEKVKFLVKGVLIRHVGIQKDEFIEKQSQIKQEYFILKLTEQIVSTFGGAREHKKPVWPPILKAHTHASENADVYIAHEQGQREMLNRCITAYQQSLNWEK